MRLLIMRAFSSLLLCCLLAGSGCTTTGTQRAANDAAPHAECLVCKHEADLACLNVKITDQTPRYDYDGHTYYFCSTECRDQFVRDPWKYIH